MAIAVQYYICNTCRFRTTILSRIEDHLQAHASSKEPSRFPYFDCFDRLKPLKCTSCDFSTESLLLLRYHLVRKHDQQKFPLKATLQTCKKCEFCTHSNYLWLRHGIFGTCKKSKNKASQLKRKRDRVSCKKQEKWYLCEECDYRTTKFGNLKIHIIYKHTPLDEIDWKRCKKCPSKFKTIVCLRMHQRRVHMSEMDRLYCAKCDYSTPTRSLLTLHFKRKHARPEEIKWLECYKCDAKFKDKAYLHAHLKRHSNRENAHKVSDITWLKCEHCDFRTKYKGSLKTHVLVKHSKDGTVFQCKECDYKTTFKYYLLNHMKRNHQQVEATISCKDCSFVTKTQYQLRLHIFNRHTVHTEEDELKCPHCTFFCFTKGGLKQHLQYKHKDKIWWYKCDKCDYENCKKTSFISHMFMVHNDGKLLECDQCIFKTGSPVAMWKHKKKHETNQWIPKTVSEKLECYICGFRTDKKQYIRNHIIRNHLKKRK